MLAIITNKRRHHNQNGAHICAVTCPACGFTRGLSFGGWSAIVCGGCKATLNRSKASQNAPTAAESRQTAQQAFADFAAGSLEKWAMYGILFGLMESRRLTLTEIKSIGSSYGVTAGAIQMRRADWINFRSMGANNASA